MGFEFGTFINSIITSSYGEVFNNPIWSALTIVLIILIIIYFVFREHFCASEDDDVSFWRLLFRAGIYIAASTIVIFFIHYKNVSYDFEKKYEDKLLSQTVSTAIAPTPTPPPVISQVPIPVSPPPVMTYAIPILPPSSLPPSSLPPSSYPPSVQRPITS